jgi:hypothetical protein
VRQINTLHAQLFAVLEYEEHEGGDSDLLDRSRLFTAAGSPTATFTPRSAADHTCRARRRLCRSAGTSSINETPVGNLFASMLERVGVLPEHVGDSTGRLNGLSLS